MKRILQKISSNLALYLTFWAIANSIGLYAQQNPSELITISGEVKDAQTDETLVGVAVANKSEGTGTATNYNGQFSLQVKPGTTLEFRYVGYTNQEIIANTNTNNLTIKLSPSGYDLNPVVISGSRRKEKILDSPNSLTLIDNKTITAQVSSSPADLLKNTPSVDVMKTGIQGANVVIRGFNNLFSTDALLLIDNRVISIPSLRANVLQMMPISEDDIDRIEVLRGPASALYGPNCINGAVHYITRSPIDFQNTKVSVGIGLREYIPDTILTASPTNSPVFDNKNWTDRSVYTLAIRHAEKVRLGNTGWQGGYKLSANFMRGNDWRYNDINEPDSIIKGIQSPVGRIELAADGTPITTDSLSGDYVNNIRDNKVNKLAFDIRLDARYKEEAEIVLSGGMSSNRDIILTPLGAMQNIDWRYWYSQLRMRYKNLFAQVYVNGNASGDSYFLQTGDRSIEKSKLWAAQIQHNITPFAKLRLIYGLDAFFTRPNTEGSIYGRYEDKDNINEYGLYTQADYRLSPKLTLTAALRADYHDVGSAFFLSPKGALVYKPDEKNTIRATVNRAFKTAGSGAFFLDVTQGSIPTGIDIRAEGNMTGFPFSFSNNPYYNNQYLPQFRTAYGTSANTYYNVGDQSINNAAWQGILGVIFDNLALTLANDPTLAPYIPLLNSAVGIILPDTISGVGHSVKDLNLTTRTFSQSDWENIKSIDPMKHTSVVTYELGYKGVLGKSIFLGIDLYRTDMKDYIAPVTVISPLVMLNTDELAAYLAPIVYDKIAASGLEPLLEGLIDQNPTFGGNNNGRVDDEVVNIITTAAAQLPIGVINPTNATGPSMILATRNIGSLSVYGADVSASMYLSKKLRLNATYSWVDKDSIVVEGAQYGFVGLNAPRHKVRLGADYTQDSWGLTVGAQFRWQAGFPANSGIYIGRVAPRHEVDLNVSWTPQFYKQINITLSIQNLYNNVTQYFIGTPQIGRFSMLRFTHNI